MAKFIFDYSEMMYLETSVRANASLEVHLVDIRELCGLAAIDEIVSSLYLTKNTSQTFVSKM